MNRVLMLCNSIPECWPTAWVGEPFDIIKINEWPHDELGNFQSTIDWVNTLQKRRAKFAAVVAKIDADLAAIDLVWPSWKPERRGKPEP